MIAPQRQGPAPQGPRELARLRGVQVGIVMPPVASHHLCSQAPPRPCRHPVQYSGEPPGARVTSYSLSAVQYWQRTQLQHQVLALGGQRPPGFQASPLQPDSGGHYLCVL